MEDRKKLYIISEVFYPESVATGYIFTEISEHLKKEFDITVISGPISYTENLGWTGVDLTDVDVVRVNVKKYNKDQFFSRLLGQIRISLAMLKLMLKEIPSDSKVLMCTNPVLLLFLVSFFRKWKTFLIVHDVFPDNIVATGFLSKNNIILKFLNFVFLRSYKFAHHLIVLGEDMRIKMKNKVKHERISIIQNWSDPQKLSVVLSPNEDSPTVFLFAGNLGRLQGLDYLLSALIKFKDRKDVLFIFKGDGASKKTLQEMVRLNGVSNILFEDFSSRDSQKEFLSRCHIGIVSLGVGMYGLGVPSKTYSLLSAGKPILYIGECGTEIDRMIKCHSNGWTVEIGDEESLISCVNNILEQDIHTIQEKGKKSRSLAENVYSKQILLNKLTEIIKK